MKKRKLFESLLVVAFVSVFVLASCTNKTKQEEGREDVIESEKYKQLVYVSSSDWRFAPTDNEVKRMLQ